MRSAKLVALQLLFSLSLQLTYACVPCSAQYAPAVGDRHADFILPHIETRDPVSLSQFRGKPVLLIHFASW